MRRRIKVMPHIASHSPLQGVTINRNGPHRIAPNHAGPIPDRTGPIPGRK